MYVEFKWNIFLMGKMTPASFAVIFAMRNHIIPMEIHFSTGDVSMNQG